MGQGFLFRKIRNTFVKCTRCIQNRNVVGNLKKVKILNGGGYAAMFK